MENGVSELSDSWRLLYFVQCWVGRMFIFSVKRKVEDKIAAKWNKWRPVECLMHC